jgi:tungstate transport system substrate-binding protein
MRQGLRLSPLVEGDPTLFNQYGVIPVVGAREPVGARAFADWITSPAGQAVIRSFGVARFGRSLFVPNARRR